jgi:hypothetical protein
VAARHWAPSHALWHALSLVAGCSSCGFHAIQWVGFTGSEHGVHHGYVDANSVQRFSVLYRDSKTWCQHSCPECGAFGDDGETNAAFACIQLMQFLHRLCATISCLRFALPHTPCTSGCALADGKQSTDDVCAASTVRCTRRKVNISREVVLRPCKPRTVETRAQSQPQYSRQDPYATALQHTRKTSQKSRMDCHGCTGSLIVKAKNSCAGTRAQRIPECILPLFQRHRIRIEPEGVSFGRAWPVLRTAAMTPCAHRLLSTRAELCHRSAALRFK